MTYQSLSRVSLIAPQPADLRLMLYRHRPKKHRSGPWLGALALVLSALGFALAQQLIAGM